jgi:hypothetical protein
MKGVTICRVARVASLAFLVPSNVQGHEERASLAGTVTGAVIPGISPFPAVQTLQQWFNPLAFSVPPAACYCYGNSGRDVLTRPRAANLDLTAAKRFRITESSNVGFRAGFFNALNHPQFAIPGNTTIGINDVGSISSTARASRQIQFALRFVF